MSESELPGENFVDFKCPYCGALNSFPTSAANLTRECMNCLEAFLVPSKGEEVARPVPLPIGTSKFHLRRFTATDWKDLLEFQCADEDEATEWLQRISQTRFADLRQPFFLAIELLSSAKVIGSVSFTFVDLALNQMEVSLSSEKAAALHGLELEVLETALEFCFRELNLHRVIAQCGAQEAGTQRLYARLGMRKEAEFVKHQFVNGEWLSTAWFAILEEEYFSDATQETSPG
jgi:RimJ/RimL family protein N-acetyltransferase